MKLLLDTHALLWWLAGDLRLSERTRARIADAGSEVYVSAASAWEMATKARLGKLPNADFLVHQLTDYLSHQGFLGLDISVEHTQRAGSLPGAHKDPFDRMLIAQAQAENLVLVSNESVFDRYGVQRLW